ncbi:MAG: cupin domain-containing protein [Gemmatimonadaceae bacterium]
MTRAGSRRITFALTAFTLAACGPGATVEEQPAATAQPEAAVMTAESRTMDARAASSLVWGDLVVEGFNPGAKISVLNGDPAAAGPYTLRLRFPDGYEFPVHWHPGVENLTVLSGTFLLSMGNTADRTAQRAYGPGDYLYIPARMSHFGGARGETVIQLHGIGPFAINLGTPTP